MSWVLDCGDELSDDGHATQRGGVSLAGVGAVEQVPMLM